MVRATRYGAALAAALCVALPATAATIVDDFSDTPSGFPSVLQLTTPSSSSFLDQIGLTGVVGFHRFMSLDSELFDTPGVDQINAGVYPAAGVLDYNSTAGADGRLTLMYIGPGSLDLDLTGDQLLRIGFSHFDYPGNTPMDVAVTLNDGVNNALLTLPLTGPAPKLLDFPFVSFVGMESVDASTIHSIKVEFFPGEGFDFRVNEITTEIPEPASIALLGSGAMATLVRRRNRR